MPVTIRFLNPNRRRRRARVPPFAFFFSGHFGLWNLRGFEALSTTNLTSQVSPWTTAERRRIEGEKVTTPHCSPTPISFSGHPRPPDLLDHEAPTTANSTPPRSPQNNTGGRRSEDIDFSGHHVHFGNFETFRSVLVLVTVMNVGPCVVIKLPVKYCSHRRWLDRRSVGSTRRRLRRRVRARPATSDGVVWFSSSRF